MKKIKYRLLCRQDVASLNEKGEMTVEQVAVLSHIETDYSESEYQRILGIAYNGEVTVEEMEDPVTEPTQLDRVEAQVTYTALMTDTLLSYEEA